MRQTAKKLRCSYMTVYRKFKWLGKRAMDLHHQQTLQAEVLFFDETLSIEHTKLKPLTIALAVNEKYQILGAKVGRIKAFGRTADISVKKYGPRPNESNQKVKALLNQVKVQLKQPPSAIRSDKKSDYKSLVQKIFPTTPYEQHLSRGNKEKRREQKYLKTEKHTFDPLFPLNQRCALLRDHIKRLTRRSWCTSKKPEHLQLALYLYIAKNNAYTLI